MREEIANFLAEACAVKNGDGTGRLSCSAPGGDNQRIAGVSPAEGIGGVGSPVPIFFVPFTAAFHARARAGAHNLRCHARASAKVNHHIVRQSPVGQQACRAVFICPQLCANSSAPPVHVLPFSQVALGLNTSKAALALLASSDFDHADTAAYAPIVAYAPRLLKAYARQVA